MAKKTIGHQPRLGGNRKQAKHDPSTTRLPDSKVYFHCWTEMFFRIIKAITRLFVLREAKRFLVLLFTAVL